MALWFLTIVETRDGIVAFQRVLLSQVERPCAVRQTWLERFGYLLQDLSRSICSQALGQSICSPQTGLRPWPTVPWSLVAMHSHYLSDPEFEQNFQSWRRRGRDPCDVVGLGMSGLLGSARNLLQEYAVKGALLCTAGGNKICLPGYFFFSFLMPVVSECTHCKTIIIWSWKDSGSQS